jgi:CYTH domain-containing protein
MARVNQLYTYAEKKKLGSGIWQKVERVLAREEYQRLIGEANPNLRRILKTRYTFSYEHQYFQLDAFTTPIQLTILEVELTESTQEVLMPPFIKVIKEVTDDEEYSNARIANPSAPPLV